jgi:hypothetical protein
MRAFALYGATEGKVGVDGGGRISGQASDALAVIGDARAWKLEQEIEATRKGQR